MFSHFPGAGGAIQAQGLHAQGMDDRGGAGDIGADQQGTRGFHGHLGQYGHFAAGLGHGHAGAIDRRLELQDILHRLDHDAVNATRQQTGGLRRQGGLQFVIVDLAQAGQLGAGPDIAQDITLDTVTAELTQGLASQFGSTFVDFVGPVLEVEFR